MKLPRWSYFVPIPVLLGLVFAGVSLADKPKMQTVPAGGIIQVKLDHALASNQNRSGDTF